MANKNIKLICTIFFLVGIIIFVISVVTNYKTYTDSEIVKAKEIRNTVFRSGWRKKRRKGSVFISWQINPRVTSGGFMILIKNAGQDWMTS